jgi:hypothetical protein
MSNNSLLVLITLSVALGLLAAAWCAYVALRWARTKTKSGSILAIAAFPYLDEPPPHELCEQENRLKKSTTAGDPEE